MEHPEVEELLGAYALDALDRDEAEQVELHLIDCPRCRAEVAAHREVASLLGASGANAPDGLWERIGAEIGGAGAPAPEFDRVLTFEPRRSSRRRRLALPLGALAAAVVAAVVGLSLEVGHLNGEVRSFQSATRSNGLAPLVASALAEGAPVVHLTAEVGHAKATVARSKSGLAYWAGGTGLAALPAGETYQLWALVKGRAAPVSLALLGQDLATYSAFRVNGDVVRLMVTVEPAGGTAAPTTPVLLSGVV